MTNEISNVSENTEILTGKVIKETENFVIKQNADGKYQRKAKFQNYSSITATTREDRIWLANLLDGDEDSGNGLKDHVGTQIEVADVITRQYDRINEETGEIEYGVLTYLITPDRVAYITSSAGVHFSIMNYLEALGKPTDPEWQNLIIQIGKKRMTNGDGLVVKLVG